MSHATRLSICLCLAVLSLMVLASAAQAAELRAVDFIGPSTGWVAGDGGLVLKTTDGGKTWIVQHKGGVDHIYGIDFVSASRGWAVSSTDGILRTTDGGKRWSRRSVVSDGGSQDLYCVRFINRRVGWMVGGSPDDRPEDTHQPYGLLYASTNGGRTWTLRKTVASCPMAVDAGSAATVVAVGVDRIQPTEEGGCNVLAEWLPSGASWTGPTHFPGYDTEWGELYAVDRAAAGLVVAGGKYSGGYGGDPAIMRSTDGGLTWTMTVPPALDAVRGITMATNRVGYAVGEGSVTKILKTTDGGVSWFTRSVPFGSHLWAVDFVTASTGYAVGYREGATPVKSLVLKTVDGGTTWKRVR